MNFHGWQIDLPEKFFPYLAVEEKKMILMTSAMDEIQATLTLDDEQHLVIDPGWNVKLTILGEKHVKVSFKTTEFEDFNYEAQIS